jgi:hypothetical protein
MTHLANAFVVTALTIYKTAGAMPIKAGVQNTERIFVSNV